MFDDIEPCFNKYRGKDENNADHETTSELKVEEILRKEIPRNTSHKERENESDPKGYTISQFPHSITILILPGRPIIVHNIICVISLLSNITVHQPKLMLIFQLLNKFLLLGCTLRELDETLNLDFRDDVGFGNVLVQC